MASNQLMESLSHHSPSNEQVIRINRLRQAAVEFGTILEDSTPKGRHLSLATTKLEEALMWAVKGVILTEDDPPPPYAK